MFQIFLNLMFAFCALVIIFVLVFLQRQINVLHKEFDKHRVSSDPRIDQKFG